MGAEGFAVEGRGPGPGMRKRLAGFVVTMRDAENPYALRWAVARTHTDDQDLVVLTARMMGMGGPEYVDPSEQMFSEHEQMLFTKAVSVAESFGKHISLLVVPAGDVFAALVQTANSLEASAVVSGLSSKMSAEEQAFYMGQAWENLPNPKRQFTFYVVKPTGDSVGFHIGPHAPALQADDVQLVHRLWLNLKRYPEMQELHHRDIVTYALTRLAGEYARDRQEIVKELRRSVVEPANKIAGPSTRPTLDRGAPSYPIPPPRPPSEQE